jgi:hypothetical protein
MKIENIISLGKPTSSTEDLPIIKAEEIKSILYLGVRGDITLASDNKHTIDTYA